MPDTMNYRYITDENGLLDRVEEVNLDELSPEDRAEFLATCKVVVV